MKQVIITGHQTKTKEKCGFIFLIDETITNPLQHIKDTVLKRSEML